MPPIFRWMLSRFLRWPSATRFSKPAKAFSIRAENRLRMACSLSFRAVERHKNVGFFSIGNTDTLDLHFGSDLMPIVVQQLPLKLFQLGSRCAHQVLAATTPDRFEVVFADDPTVEDPHPARAAVLAFDHAENGFHRGHIPTI